MSIGDTITFDGYTAVIENIYPACLARPWVTARVRYAPTGNMEVVPLECCKLLSA